MPRQLEFFVPGRDLASILVASARSQALQGALSGVPGRPWRPSGHSRGALETLRDAPETLPRHLRDALGHHEASREGSGSYFKAILGAPGPLPASILDRYLHGPSPDRHSPARLGSSWSSTSYVYMRGPPPEDARKMLGSCSEIARGSHAARLLMLRPSGCSTLEQLSPKGLSRFWCDFA